MERVIIEPQYQPYVLKEYTYWTLLLHDTGQRYLGRAVVWLARAGEMQKFSGLQVDELLELRQIAQEYEAVLDKVGWKPDHMNYTMLGNFFHEHAGHAHMHLIPRYKAPRTFMDVSFIDERWGKNYSPAEAFHPGADVLAGMVTLLKNGLSQGVAA